MVVSEELIEIIDSDIKTCELAIQRGNKDELWEVHSRLVSKYSNIIEFSSSITVTGRFSAETMPVVTVPS